MEKKMRKSSKKEKKEKEKIKLINKTKLNKSKRGY